MENKAEVMQAYLHNPPGQESALWTVSARHKITGKPLKGDTLSCYGKALPTHFMVLFNGRWYRVKTARHGNAGTTYIGKPGAWIARVQFVWEMV